MKPVPQPFTMPPKHGTLIQWMRVRYRIRKLNGPEPDPANTERSLTLAEKEIKQKKKGCFGKCIKWLFLIILGLLLILTVWNFICGLDEKKKLRQAAYGQTVDVNGKKMTAEIKGGEHDTTIILLPGLGSVSPVLEFRPLAEKLSAEYRVITVEPFGYGLSDPAGSDRTLNAVVNELHSCVQSLGCTDYYLMGHSLSGIYMLAWANQYPDEVEGFIGIDNSVPKQEDCNPLPVSTITVNQIAYGVSRFMNFTGIMRLLSVSDHRAILTADASYPYSQEDIDLCRLLTLHRSVNKDVRNELKCLEKNMAASRQKTLPESVPALIFVASSNCDFMPEWEQLHKDIVTEKEHSEVIKLQGEHYLHFDNLQNITDAVFAWIPADAQTAPAAAE